MKETAAQIISSKNRGTRVGEEQGGRNTPKL
jgi:hypothetical protein